MTRGKRIYVLDTNVLMHDPTALFKFEEHDVFLPMQVIEELDNAKKGTSEVSRNARQVSRFLDELLENTNAEQIQAGILLSHPQGIQLKGQAAIGRLFFQIKPIDPGRTFGEMLPDNKILASVLALREENPDVPVILVSKDINLRIKAYISGLVAEDYQNDRALDDFSLLFTGAIELPEDFWQKHNEDLRSWNERGRTHYEIVLAEDEDWYPNQYLYLPGEDEVELRVAKVGGGKATLCLVDDFRSGQHAVWGIVARNREQNFALNALMDPEIDFVTLLGTAGTGKTLLALAAGLAQTMAIAISALKQMFDHIRSETDWNLDGPLRWEYFFADPAQEPLQKLAEQLTQDGYRVIDIFLGERDEDDGDDEESYFLHVDKKEHHTIESLNQRNAQFDALAKRFHVAAYDGMDVGPA